MKTFSKNLEVFLTTLPILIKVLPSNLASYLAYNAAHVASILRLAVDGAYETKVATANVPSIIRFAIVLCLLNMIVCWTYRFSVIIALTGRSQYTLPIIKEVLCKSASASITTSAMYASLDCDICTGSPGLFDGVQIEIGIDRVRALVLLFGL